MKLITQIYIFIIILLTSVSVHADTHVEMQPGVFIPKMVVCFEDGNGLISNMHDKFGENIFSISQSQIRESDGDISKTQIIYMRNSVSKTYTVVEINRAGMGCVIASGEHSEVINIEPQKPKVPESKI